MSDTPAVPNPDPNAKPDGVVSQPPGEKRPEDLTAEELASPSGSPDIEIDLWSDPLSKVGEFLVDFRLAPQSPAGDLGVGKEPEIDAPELPIVPDQPVAVSPVPSVASPIPTATPTQLPPAVVPPVPIASQPTGVPSSLGAARPQPQPVPRTTGQPTARGTPQPNLGVPARSADAPQPRPAPVSATPPPSQPSVPKTPPVWKVLEPDDPSDPIEHEVFEARAGCPGWQIIAASVRGKLHAHKAQWREDSFKWGTTDGWTVLAVSDGAGSSRLSRVASRLACESAVTHLQQLLAGYTVAPADQQPTDGDLQRLRSLLADAGGKSRMAILLEAQRRAASVKDFSATLLVVAHTAWQDRDLVVALLVGDAAIGLATVAGAKRLGTSDHGQYSSETKFLTTPGVELEFHNRVLFSLPLGLTAIALMSDGVSDDFYPEEKRIGEVFHADPIDGLTAKGGGTLRGLLGGVAKETRGGEALRDWLRYEKRGSSDDRTLVLMHRSQL